MPERVLFVHAHPDDESIVTGGAIATLVARGTPVTVLTCTRGEKGEVIPPDIAHLEGDDDALAAFRETEIAAAMTALGVLDHRFLGRPDARRVDSDPRRYRDSGMRWGDHGPEPLETMAADALCAADPAEVAADIATVIVATHARAVVSYDPRGGYGHPDHVAVHIASRAAADAMGVPFFAILGDGDGDGDGDSDGESESDASRFSIDVHPVLPLKLAALRAYRSQLTVDGGLLRMPGGQVESISLVERFERMPPEAADDATTARSSVPPGEWKHLGRGARILSSVVAVVLGVAAAGIGTVVHQVRPEVLGVPVPVGLVLSLFAVAALLVGLRLTFDSRILATIAAAAFLVVVNVLSKQSTGGSVLIEASPPGYWWVYAPVAIAFLVLAWPKLPTRPRDRIDPVFESKGIPAP